MTNETLDDAGVLAKFGVRADQVLDLLTLTGDAVDNVPGVPKVGPKTAAKWLAQYGTLDNLVAHAGEIAGVVGDNLRSALEWLPQGRRLLTVKTDCDAARDAAATSRSARPTRERLRELYERFEFKSWLRDVAAATAIADPRSPSAAARDAGRRSARTSRRDAPAPRAAASRLRDGADERRRSTTWLARSSGRRARVVRHVETTCSIRCTAEIVGMSFAIEPGRACYIPVGHRYAGAPAQLDREPRARRVAPWLADPQRAEARPEPQVRRSTCSPITASTLRGHRARHAARVVRARVAQAARHGQASRGGISTSRRSPTTT